MSYTKQNFKDGEVLNAAHLNHIEDGIEYVGTLIDSHNFSTTAHADIREQISQLSSEIADLKAGDTSIRLTNLYNPSLQTADTISPHFYYDGVPYSSTEYDANYNCTAPIEVESNKTYTIVLIPGVGGYTLPWGNAVQGLFFYDASGNYISRHYDGNTFTTPENTAYIRFNYAIVRTVRLDVLNDKCVLVEGDIIPPSYIAYGETLVIETESDADANAKMYYQTVSGGVYVNAPYSADYDISFFLCKKGPNSIFDFSTIGLVEATSPVSNVITPVKNIVAASGDWHAPYVVSAVNNADGDNVSSYYFTGGNHGYDNTANGVATGRTDNLKMYADGKTLNNDVTGYCNELRIEWDNFIQGFNTTKSDGTGREILREHITMIFDGFTWKSETTIYPLEAIKVQTWYGLQLFTANYDYVAYINGADGLIYEQSENSESGNAITNAMRFFNLEDTAIVEFDTMYDLGTRRFASATTKGFFARGSYGKAYGTIIGTNTELVHGGVYSMRGSYTFKHEIQYAPADAPVTSILNLNRNESNSANSYLASNSETCYINPAKSNAPTVSGTPCTVSTLTENSITVKESGAGSTGCAFPIDIDERYGKKFLFTWDATGTTNTRMFLTCFGNSNAKYIQIDKSGTKSSCTIEISADGTSIIVDGVTNTGNGNPFGAMCFFFGSATGTTTSYTGVKLVEVTE